MGEKERAVGKKSLPANFPFLAVPFSFDVAAGICAQGQWKAQAQRGLPQRTQEHAKTKRVRGEQGVPAALLGQSRSFQQLFLWCVNENRAGTVGHWSLKQEHIMNTKWKRMTVTFIYLSSFQWILPSPIPTRLPSFFIGWIAVFEQSDSSC